tara:strand:+ start:253 stop:993 length:741 start_codon:yes stop_codon:yes gene_type:complete
MNKHKIFIHIMLLAVFLTPQYAYANKKGLFKNVDEYKDVFMPELQAGSVYIDDDDIPPREPVILKIEFRKQPVYTSIDHKIGALLHGIHVDTPPEYDHYGYEIRRYMASVGNLKIYESEEFIVQQIKNVRKARVIVEYWQAKIQNDVNEIEAEIEKMENVSSVVKTNLKKNKAEARSFMADLQRWIDSNERFLKKAYEMLGYIDVYYPELVFLRPHERVDFFNLLQIKQVALKRMKQYEPFAIMVY